MNIRVFTQFMTFHKRINRGEKRYDTEGQE